MREIAIVDYGVGNLHSAANAFRYLGVNTRITGDPAELERADGILLPGVGAFPDAAERLRDTGLGPVVLEQGRRKPVLGICLGMQLLLDWGEESRPCPGLGALPGRAARIPTAEKLPHVGWNSLEFRGDSPLLRGLDEGCYVYFVHSYSAQGVPPEQVRAVTRHGAEIAAVVERGNFFGCQFHPEKSGEVGLAILRNFAELG